MELLKYDNYAYVNFKKATHAVIVFSPTKILTESHCSENSDYNYACNCGYNADANAIAVTYTVAV